MSNTDINLYPERKKFCDSQFNRSQCLRLLELTGHQFDYAIKIFDIKPLRIGYGAIFTGNQLIDIKLALYLKGLKYPVEVIKYFISVKNKCVSYTRQIPKENFPIEEEQEFDKYRVISFSYEPNNYNIFVEIEKEFENKSLFDLHKFQYNDGNEDSFYLFLNEEQLKDIREKLDDEIEEVTRLSLTPISRTINNELQESSKKHNIPIGVL
jgi:hypothetical protein